MDGKLGMKANILDKLIERIMEGGFDDKASEEEALEGEPNAEMKMVAIEAEPKKKIMGM